MNVIEQKKILLSTHSIFSSLNPSELKRLSEQTEELRFDTHETVFEFGTPARTMFLVMSGEISVMKNDDYGNSREIAKVIAGDSLGEIDMITGAAYSVTAIASTSAVLIQFPPVNMSFRQFLDANPAPGSKILYAFISDIAERTRAANALLKNNSPYIKELRRQIYEDKLTNLFNKTYLEETLPQWLNKKDARLSLLMIKPDNFKQVNDNAGHEAGDNLLVHLAAVLPAYLPPHSVLIRYIGNEFALVLPDTDRESAVKLAEIIRLFYNTLDITDYLPEDGFHLTVSIGIALYPEHAKNAQTLIEEAHKLPLIGRGRGGNLILFPEDAEEKRK